MTAFAFLALTFLLSTDAVFADELTTTTTVTKTVAFRTSTATTFAPASTGAPSRESGSLPSSMPAAGSGSYSQTVFETAILNSTNYFRSRYLAEAVQWDLTLARFARQHAETCVFEHSGGPYGENLAEGFATPALGVDAWAAEEEHYRFPDGGFSESTGHFTQLVWQNTTQVGCAAVNCGQQRGVNGAFGWYLVCEYEPPGNVIGQFPYNVLKPGESKSGELGFGEMSGGSVRCKISMLSVALVAASMSVWMWA